MGSSLLSTRTSAQILPERACHSQVSPPKKPYWLLKSLGWHFAVLSQVLPLSSTVRYGSRPGRSSFWSFDQVRPPSVERKSKVCSSTFPLSFLCWWKAVSRSSPLGSKATQGL